MKFFYIDARQPQFARRVSTQCESI